MMVYMIKLGSPVIGIDITDRTPSNWRFVKSPHIVKRDVSRNMFEATDPMKIEYIE